MSNWDESKHPRVPEGNIDGGHFTDGQMETVVRSAREGAGLKNDGWYNQKDRVTAAKKFVEARDKLSAERREVLSHYTADELASSTKEIFIHEDGQNGFLLDNGDLQNLFSTNGQGNRSMQLALARGAKTLDCFEPFLPGYYSKYGFVEYKRESNWTPGGFDVVYMQLKERK